MSALTKCTNTARTENSHSANEAVKVM